MKPCQDDYNETFGSLALMMDYHEQQTQESSWQRMPISRLRVLPLDEASLPAVTAIPFAPPVSQTAIEDTVSNLGLAADTGEGLYPIRKTAINSLLDRAKVKGNVLKKMPRPDLAKIINLCLKEHKSDALLLIRDEKISAVLSGDEMDYSVLPINVLMDSLIAHLDKRFPGYKFVSGYSDHSVTTAIWQLSGQRGDLLKTYDKALIAHGRAGMAGKFTPGIRLIISDIGASSASVSALLMGMERPIKIGEAISVQHRYCTTVQQFEASLDMLYAQYQDTVSKLTHMMDVYLDYPVNAMTAICKKQGLPKKQACEAIDMFSMAYGSDPASAHDVYMGLQEILFLLKSNGTPESKLLKTEEAIIQTLSCKWEDFDLAIPVNY